MSELKPCPCGKVPTGLNIDSEGGKWAYVSGNCCSQWSIEFRANYQYGDSLMAIAVETWNGEARAESSLIERMKNTLALTRDLSRQHKFCDCGGTGYSIIENELQQIIDEYKEG